MRMYIQRIAKYPSMYIHKGYEVRLGRCRWQGGALGQDRTNQVRGRYLIPWHLGASDRNSQAIRKQFAGILQWSYEEEGVSSSSASRYST